MARAPQTAAGEEAPMSQPDREPGELPYSLFWADAPEPPRPLSRAGLIVAFLVSLALWAAIFGGAYLVWGPR